jgi:hypothetical protein
MQRNATGRSIRGQWLSDAVMDNDFDEFLARLFQEGKIGFPTRPVPLTAVPAGALGLLERAYATYRLDVPGTPLDFDARLACAAAELVRQASWALVFRPERIEDLERRLTMPRPPKSAADHLSADLLLRYLPLIHRRARALDPADPLVGLIERVLRQWPLSGVLAGLDEGPTSALDFGGHEGLMLLYAERQARGTSPGWRPAGRPLEFVELIAGGEGAGAGRDRP